MINYIKSQLKTIQTYIFLITLNKGNAHGKNE